MPDDKSITDNRDRSQVAAGEDYEVEYLANKFRISIEKARDLIERYGNDRETLERHIKNIT